MDENVMEDMEQEVAAATVRTICFDDEEVVVQSCEPYQEDYGKGALILEIKIHEDNITQAQLDKLKAKPECISYYRDGVLKNTYDGYTAGYTCFYDDQTGIYFVRLRFMGEFEHEVKQNTANIDFLAIMAGVEL